MLHNSAIQFESLESLRDGALGGTFRAGPSGRPLRPGRPAQEVFKKVQNGAQNEQETVTYIVKRAKVKSYKVLHNSAFNLVRKNKGFRVEF